MPIAFDPAGGGGGVAGPAVVHPARWHSPAGWSLRTRLIAIMIVLLTVLGLVVGTATEIFLHKTLYDRLDSQLQETASRAQKRPGFPGGDPHLGGGQFSGRVPPGAQPRSIFLNVTRTGIVNGGIVTVGAD